MHHVFVKILARPTRDALHLEVGTLDLLPLVYHFLSAFNSAICSESSFHLRASAVVTGCRVILTYQMVDRVVHTTHTSTIREDHVLRRVDELLDVIVGELEVVLERGIVAQLIKALVCRAHIQVCLVLLVVHTRKASQIIAHSVLLVVPGIAV